MGTVRLKPLGDLDLDAHDDARKLRENRGASATIVVWVAATPLIGVGMYLTREKT